MKLATIGDIMKMLVMLREWCARNGPDLNGEGRSQEERDQSEVAKAKRVATAWHPLLDDLTQEELFSAARAHSRGSTWFPTPAEIRAQVPRLQTAALALEVADPVKGRDRWADVLRHAGSIGRREDWLEELGRRSGIENTERLGAAIRDCGGWRAILQAENDYARQAMGKRFSASWDRWARGASVGLVQGGPERALADDRSGGGTAIDLEAEIQRRRALGRDGGR